MNARQDEIDYALLGRFTRVVEHACLQARCICVDGISSGRVFIMNTIPSRELEPFRQK